MLDKYRVERVGCYNGNETGTKLLPEHNKKNIFKKIFKGFGYGSAIVGGGAFYLAFFVLYFLFYVCAGLLMIRWAIILFLGGAIIKGLLVLLLGTPIAVYIAQTIFKIAFIPILILLVVSGIIFGIFHLVGFNFSFWQVWDWIWIFIKVAGMGGMFICGVMLFYSAVKEKNIKKFFKECWPGILLFCFLFWLFFIL